MTFIKSLVAAVLLVTVVTRQANAADANWRLVVAFVEESVGAINRVSRSYKLSWIRRGGDEKAHRKAFRDAEKTAIVGTKHKIWTREATTNSTGSVAIYDVAAMRNMWKGRPKKLNSLLFMKGKNAADLQKKIGKRAAKNDYLGYKAVVVIDMQAAKAYLNKQLHNPVFGNLPTSVMVVN